MTAKICSFNVRGLGNKTKREQIFTWSKEKTIFDMFTTGNTFWRCTTQPVDKGVRHNIIFQGYQNNSEVVATCILLYQNFSCTVKRYKEKIIGRLQAVELIINEKDVVISSGKFFCVKMTPSNLYLYSKNEV